MRVKTIRRHINDRPPQPVKNIHRKYEVSENLGRTLIAAKLVEEDETEGEAGE